MIVHKGVALGACIALMGILAACGSGSTPAPGDVGAPTSAPADVSAATQPPAPVDAPAPTATEPPAAARVNGEPIYVSDYQNRLAQYEAERIAQGLDPSTPDGQAQLARLREEVLDGMIEQVLILQEARLKGISVSDAELEAEKQRIIDLSGGLDAFDGYLAANGQNADAFWAEVRVAMLSQKALEPVIAGVPVAAPQVHARHILVDNAELANALLSQLQTGADFTSLAQQYSQETLTRSGGGDLGWFLRGELIAKEVEDAAFALQPGQYSGVVQSAFGYHIIQAIEVDPARPLSEEQLRQQREAAVTRWLAGLRAAANIEK